MGWGLNREGHLMVQFSVKTLLIAVAVVSAFLAGWQWGRVEHAYDSLYYTREQARAGQRKGVNWRVRSAI